MLDYMAACSRLVQMLGSVVACSGFVQMLDYMAACSRPVQILSYVTACSNSLRSFARARASLFFTALSEMPMISAVSFTLYPSR